MYKRQLAEKVQQAEEPVKAQAAVEAAAAEASWDDVAMLDPLGLEVGYRLISLVDHTQNGELLHRIRSLRRSEEHTSELQSLMRISYAVFCLKKQTKTNA